MNDFTTVITAITVMSECNICSALVPDHDAARANHQNWHVHTNLRAWAAAAAAPTEGDDA